jgi:hypothetical protein
MEVKCRYTEIYSIKGINLPPKETEKELIADSIRSLRAVLTTKPNSYAFEGDRSLAVAGMMLRGLMKLEPGSDEFKQHIANKVDEFQTRRAKKFGAGTFLVVVGEETIPSFTPFSFEGKAEDIQDFADFLVCFEGADKDEIRSRFHTKNTALLNSIAVIMGSVVGIKKVTSSVIFLREDDRPIYSYTVSGSAQVYISKPISDDILPLIESLYRQIVEDKTLQRVQRLFRSSYENEDDLLRSFLDGWMAFEIFINKIFATYKNRFFKSLLKEEHTEAQKKYLERIQDVMKGKYRLIDKFAAVSFQLSPDTADDDLKVVQQAKESRDLISHGESVDENTLPVNELQKIASKYLRLHINSNLM